MTPDYRSTILLCIAGGLLLIGCQSRDSAPLVASDVRIFAPLPGATGTAAYLTLSNNSDESIRIDKVTSPEYARVEIHETTVTDGVARMRQLPELVIPPGESVAFRRGGKHLMLMGATGQTERVTLHLMSGATALLSVTTDATARGE